ncbi:MAG TPA: fasciclin domain-containing protein [Bacteroides sp.]|nr:fasciclin domain-containing protein [Bacteroides sp.]
MKKRIYTGIAGILLIVAAGLFSCDHDIIDAGFEDMLDMTIYDYIVENDSAYSSFLAILEKGGIDKTLSAYNPNGIGYTLFLPDNEAIDQFIAGNDQFNSLDGLLNDSEYVRALSRYHVVNMAIHTDDFPFGAFPERTLSGDILTVSFAIEPDSSYYKINNQAPVIYTNIEVSNGYIHLIGNALVPVTRTTYDWLESNDGFSIFRSAADATGLSEQMDINLREVTDARPFTLLAEPDSVYQRSGIGSFNALVSAVSPEDDNYEVPSNPLYQYVSYHMLEGSIFMDDFVDLATNYSTFSDIPLNINGTGLDIMINKGKENFDTIINGVDTTIIDFIGFYYDHSNVLTQSGAIHFINQVLRQQPPSRAILTYEFYDEPLLNEYREEPGEYLIEDTAALNNFTWGGTDLYFIETGDPEHPAWGGDYLYLDGDFTITYRIPKIVQGLYSMFLRAESLDQNNAVVEVLLDGKYVGGLVDLSSGGSANNPFAMKNLGVINFLQYEGHTIQIKSLIPGKFSWDLIRFEPYKE